MFFVCTPLRFAMEISIWKTFSQRKIAGRYFRTGSFFHDTAKPACYPKIHPQTYRAIAPRSLHMTTSLILASASDIRLQLFRNAGIPISSAPANIDETMIKESLTTEGARPRDIADTLAEHKARKISNKHPASFIIGCDQVLDFGGQLLGKPNDPDDAIRQIGQLAGQSHKLHSAAVIFQNNQPVWRHIGTVSLRMRLLSEEYIAEYVHRNWDSIRHSVGGYKLEEEGIRLFHRIDGDYFHVLGLPFLEIVNYLIERGQIEG